MITSTGGNPPNDEGERKHPNTGISKKKRELKNEEKKNPGGLEKTKRIKMKKNFRKVSPEGHHKNF